MNFVYQAMEDNGLGRVFSKQRAPRSTPPCRRVGCLGR